MRPIRARLLAAAAASGLLVALLPAVAAPTFANTLDVCASGCTYSTIQAAIAAAQSSDTITIAAGTYAGPITISENLTLEGASASDTTISGGLPQVVVVNQPDVTVTLSGLTISDGSNGGIINDGTLYLIDSAVSNNQVSTSFREGFCLGASGIINEGGTLSLIDSVVTNNNGESGCDGGISNDGGSVTLTGSTVSNNKSSGGRAGGIANGGTLSLIDSAVSSNNNTKGLFGLPGNAGGIYSNGTLTVTGSTVSGNHTDGFGGGFYVANGTATLTGNAITSNSAKLDGGGIFSLSSASVTLSDNTFSGNHPDNCGGSTVC